jgi:iron complex transport system permease protein
LSDWAGGHRAHLISGRGVVGLQIALVVMLVASLLVGITYGTVTLPFDDVWRVIGWHLGWGDIKPSPVQNQIIWEFRTPRVLLAAVVGAALSLAGACLQVLARNPLADPYILGVSAGAAFGAVLAAVTGWTVLAGIGISGAAFASALVTLIVVFLLAQRTGQVGPSRLVLAGVAVSYLFTAGTSFLQLYTSPLALRGIVFWILGSLANARWDDLGIPTVVIFVSMAWLLGRARALNLMTTGDDSANALGVSVNRFRIELLIVTSMLTASSVAVAGGIGFVGLMIPHAARFVVGPDHRRLLPVALLGGAVFMVIVDLVSRVVDRPNELPVGIFTAALGAPFFLLLLRRTGQGAT